MSLGQSVRRSLLCGSCRSQLLQSFVSAAGISLPAARESHRLLQRKPFSSRTGRLAQSDSTVDKVDVDSIISELERADEDDIPDHTETAVLDELPAREEAHDSPSPRPSANEAAVPWYLQVDPPIAPQRHAISERQRLPDLPSHSPELLQPILEHVSVDLGIDDLSLLDLRALDPPPALGANLLMIIGTARSEKHLHVSADRLCRWLRSTHAMTPFADGLLGRNELKLKLRRKAKRSRLLSAVGAKETASSDTDDGIRTGWVCVNVGKVSGGLLPQQQEDAAKEIKDFVGFGSQSTACRIVVQLMTDEKRGQIDLETLWNGILRRSRQAQPTSTPEPAATDVVGATGNQIQPERPDEASSKPSPTSPSEHTVVYRPAVNVKASMWRRNADPSLHARAFHTSSGRPSPILSQVYDKGAHTTENTATATNDNVSDNISIRRGHQALLILRNLLDQLKRMDHEAAVESLGKGSSDHSTTPFLRAFYGSLPTFPDASHWHVHLELRCSALLLGHPAYSRKSITYELEKMRIACITPTEDTYMMIFETLLTPLLGAKSGRYDRVLYKITMSSALDVLDRMHEDGYNPVSERILRLLHQTTSFPPVPSCSPLLIHKSPPDDRGNDSQPSSPLTLPDLLPSLSAHVINTAAVSSSWETVIKIWRSYPLTFRARSSQTYAALFRSAARSRNQRIAVGALRSCVPEMDREEPAVTVNGEVAQAMKQCLIVAEPKAQEMGEKGERGEWAVLWRRLMRALHTK